MVTSRLVTPWRANRQPRTHQVDAEGSKAPTSLLDWEAHPILSLSAEVTASSPLDMVQQAHRLISQRVRPVYALDDSQSASKTLLLGRGSCSQRLAVLEAVVRSVGIATRVRGLLIDGKFWYPRFPRLRFAVPTEVVLAWPEFLVDSTWISASEIFPRSSALPQEAFSNSNGETLFDAIARTSVAWDEQPSAPGGCVVCDLSSNVLTDLGRFNSRDALFEIHGQTLCWGARTVANPVLSRWSAGATALPNN